MFTIKDLSFKTINKIKHLEDEDGKLYKVDNIKEIITIPSSGENFTLYIYKGDYLFSNNGMIKRIFPKFKQKPKKKINQEDYDVKINESEEEIRKKNFRIE